MIRPPPRSTLFPYTPLSRSVVWGTQPWLIDDDRPYFDEQIVRSQVAAARHAELIVASKSTHARLVRDPEPVVVDAVRSEEHTSELQSQSISYAVFCLNKKTD